VVEDIALLELIATGIVQGVESSRETGYLDVPYPPALQRGLNRLAAAARLRDSSPPGGVADLFDWARNRPLGDWGLELDGLGLALDDRLLVGSTPTALCFELAHDSKEAELAIAYERFVSDLFSACRSTGDDHIYVDLRRHLVEQPALTALQLQVNANSMPTRDLRSVLLSAYRRAGIETSLNDGSRAACGGCRALLARVGGELRCVGSQCKRFLEASVGTQFPGDQVVVELRPAVRRFIHDPGLAEIRVATALERAGWSVELWPQFDAYDVRATSASGVVWAIDVKAWTSPRLLASRLAPFPNQPAWAVAFVVIPHPIIDRHPAYLRTLSRLLREGTNVDLRVISERQLLIEARHATATRPPTRA
jgi:hypothetical protein